MIQTKFRIFGRGDFERNLQLDLCRSHFTVTVLYNESGVCGSIRTEHPDAGREWAAQRANRKQWQSRFLGFVRLKI